jgi:hypothetical protein
MEPEIATNVSASASPGLPPGTAPVPEPAFEIEFRVRNAPTMAPEIFGPYVIDTDRGYTDCRFNGREVLMRIDQRVDCNWLMGDLALEITRSSGR